MKITLFRQNPLKNRGKSLEVLCCPLEYFLFITLCWWNMFWSAVQMKVQSFDLWCNGRTRVESGRHLKYCSCWEVKILYGVSSSNDLPIKWFHESCVHHSRFSPQYVACFDQLNYRFLFEKQNIQKQPKQWSVFIEKAKKNCEKNRPFRIRESKICETISWTTDRFQQPSILRS